MTDIPMTKGKTCQTVKSQPNDCKLPTHSVSPLVWSIAGSDCTAGAGIQADTKTIHALGGMPNTIVTAVTAQNQLAVNSINAVSIEVLQSQFEALIMASSLEDAETDHLPQVIKVGLLANAEQIDWLCRQLKTWKSLSHLPPPIVVFDPVISATNGDHLTEDNLVETLKSDFLPLVDVITPNAKEVQLFTGVYLFSPSCMESAAMRFNELGCKAVVIKGGHVDIESGFCIDLGMDFDFTLNNNPQQNTYWLSTPKVETERTHGTGCTFASALATELAKGQHFRDAITIAKAFINDGLIATKKIQIDRKLANSTDLIYGPIVQQGVPDKLTVFPVTSRDFSSSLASPLSLSEALSLPESLSLTERQNLTRASTPTSHSKANSRSADSSTSTPSSSELTAPKGFKTLDTNKLALYPVVPDLAWLKVLLEAGVKTIQYRDKHLNGDALDKAIEQAVTLSNQYDAQLFINDFWELAIKHRAFGVHLGQEDLKEADLTAIKAAGLCLGVSTHGHFEYLAALQLKPSYLAIGAIFPTQTKDMTGQIQGLNNLQQLCDLQNEVPIVAIGGITLENAQSVLSAGPESIAVVTAITNAPCPKSAVEQFEKLIASPSSKSKCSHASS